MPRKIHTTRLTLYCTDFREKGRIFEEFFELREDAICATIASAWWNETSHHRGMPRIIKYQLGIARARAITLIGFGNPDSRLTETETFRMSSPLTNPIDAQNDVGKKKMFYKCLRGKIINAQLANKFKQVPLHLNAF